MIRIIITLALIIFSYITTFAQETYRITVNFNGIEANEGKLYVALYNTKESFLKEPYKGTIVAIENSNANAVFDKIQAGEYAVSAFHDLNNNGNLDTNFFGIPKEPIGTSNNAKGFMGPPKFKKAKFKVDKNTTIKIKIGDIF